jgi:hypothetical protein
MRQIKRTNTNTPKAAEREVKVQAAPGEYRIYLVSNNGLSARYTYNHLEEKLVKTCKVYEVATENTMRYNVLELLLDTFDKVKLLDLEAIAAPVAIFIQDNVNQNISGESYKYWCKTGKFKDGKEMDEQERDLWREFSAMRDELGYNVVINNISRVSSAPLKVLSGLEYVDTYCIGEVWKKVNVAEDDAVEEEA